MLALAAVVVLALLAPAAQAEDGDGTSGTSELDSDYVARGTAGDGVGWTYSSSTGTLVIYGDGTLASYDEDRWGRWAVTSITSGGEELPDPSSHPPSEVIATVSELVIEGDLTVPSGVLSALSPRSASFGDGFSEITDGMFSGCTALRSVDLTGITAMGDRAFYGCRLLTSVDIRGVTSLSLTAFQGCTALRTLSATGSTVFTSADGILYTDGGSTLYMCPPGHASEVIELPEGVTRVNLDYADVVYAVDVLEGRSVTFAEAVDGASARAVFYSSLGMRSCSFGLSGDSVVLSYRLYDGWAVVPSCLTSEGLTVADYGTSSLTLTTEASVSTVYPMGVAVLTYEDLSGYMRAGSWLVSVPEVGGTGVIQDIDGPDVEVVGYVGTESSAELDAVAYVYGIVCPVSGVSMIPGQSGGLEDLVVGDGVGIGDGAFEYCSTLRSVTADHVDQVGEGAFRYCTALETASFASCTEFGDRAFDGCTSLTGLYLGDADSVVFGEDALRSCDDLGVLTVGDGTSVEGADGVTVVHYTPDGGREISFRVVGGYLVTDWEFTSSISYTLSDGTTGTVACYGDRAIMQAPDEVWVEPNYGPGTSSGSRQVVFDTGVADDDSVVTVSYGQALGSLPEPSAWGYAFAYWALDGAEYDGTEPVTESIVLTAVWVEEGSVDTTPAWIVGIFLAAVVATFAVLAVARRRIGA